MSSALPLAGANTSMTTADAMFKPGTPFINTSNQTWVYVQATPVAIAATTVVIVNASFEAVAGAGAYTTSVAIPALHYGWVRKTASPL